MNQYLHEPRCLQGRLTYQAIAPESQALSLSLIFNIIILKNNVLWAWSEFYQGPKPIEALIAGIGSGMRQPLLSSPPKQKSCKP